MYARSLYINSGGMYCVYSVRTNSERNRNHCVHLPKAHTLANGPTHQAARTNIQKQVQDALTPRDTAFWDPIYIRRTPVYSLLGLTAVQSGV